MTEQFIIIFKKGSIQININLQSILFRFYALIFCIWMEFIIEALQSHFTRSCN